jgi:hypothetical protein
VKRLNLFKKKTTESNNLLSGWIYKITHKDAKDGKNRFPKMCYIGQHRGTTIQTRFNQHKNDAKKFEHSESGRREGKFAKLHETMRIARVENFIIEELETFKTEDEHELVEFLNSAETRYIKKFDSIVTGWNSVEAPQTVRVRSSTDESLVQIANKNGIVYNSLRHRVNNMNETIEEAVEHLTNLENPSKYLYKRQVFDDIGKLSKSNIHNPNDINRKTLEVRIRKLKKKNKLERHFDEDESSFIYILPDSIFKEVTRRKKHSVTTPDGEVVNGPITDLHKKLVERYPDNVPVGYTTVQGRMNKPHWNIQQAFGFDYPPDLMEVKSLIEDEGYKWAVEKPDFKRQNSKPVILNSKKEIFSSQNEFSETYGLANDLVSDHITAGKTAEEVLIYYKLKP